jgi:hypothetical protein
VSGGEVVARRTTCIREAARLVGDNAGEAERLLGIHRERPDGRCAGCGSHLVHWPCVMVAIAEEALTLPQSGTQ